MTEPPPSVDRAAIAADLERARVALHELVEGASAEELDRSSSGTRWTNEQLLFHMVFGYMVVRRLLILVRMISRLPDHRWVAELDGQVVGWAGRPRRWRSTCG